MSLDILHIETLIEAYTEAAILAQRLVEKHSNVYLE